MLVLFGDYPSLQDKLPYVALGDFPAPVERLDRLEQAIDTPLLYVKRHDLSGKVYGSNKVRAGYDFRHQIDQGLLSEPDLVNVPLARLGMAAGLTLGVRAAGLKCQVTRGDNGGMIMGRKLATPRNMVRLFPETNARLRSRETTFHRYFEEQMPALAG